MRITGGTIRGRKLTSLRGTENRIRPTSDRARQAIFNILGDRVRGSNVIDLYAGTGALGIEALSRGADFAVFIDHAREAGEMVSKNLQLCFREPRAFIFLQKLPSPSLAPKIFSKVPKGTLFDLVFLDPPYKKGLAVTTVANIEEAKILSSKAMVIIEEHQDVSLPENIGSLYLTDKRKYGETRIWFYSPATDKCNNDDS